MQGRSEEMYTPPFTQGFEQRGGRGRGMRRVSERRVKEKEGNGEHCIV